MLIELLSTSNYVSYNVKLAELLGLHAAIYLSELMNINDKAIRKNKLNANYFKLKREYITQRTTLDEKEQLDIEKNLLKLGILEKGESDDDLSLNITTLTTLMMSTDETLIGNVKKLKKLKVKEPKEPKEPRVNKEEKIKQDLRNNIVTENAELRAAYGDWIDSVYAKQGWLSKVAVVSAQNAIDEFSKRNLDVALKVLEIAAVNGYRDMQWAISKYQKEHTINYKIISDENTQTTQIPVLSSEVF